MQGDPVDLRVRALCVVCGADMWPCRSDKMYCSASCSSKDLWRLEREAKLEARAGRRCAECGGPVPVELKAGRHSAECGRAIPETMKATAIFCSTRCRKNRWQRRARRRASASGGS